MSTMNQLQDIIGRFQQHFQQSPAMLVKACGRINLIGEHTDYNQGYVLPGAVDKYIYFALGRNESSQFNAVAADINDQISLPISAIKPTDKSWANYLLGILHQFFRYHIETGGINVVFGGNLPIGAGISSSAALEGGFGLAINEFFNEGRFSRSELARLAQRSSNQFIGVPTGIMDQFASLHGKQGHVLKLDCENLQFEYYPFNNHDVQLVLLNSKVSHALENSGYRDRVQETKEGLDYIQSVFPTIRSFKEVSLAMLNQVKKDLRPLVWHRCYYVVSEINRVELVTQALIRQDFKMVGELMFQTHQGLRDDYEVSCEEIDFLVDFAQKQREVLGARIMGGGFGGVTINLMEAKHLELFKSKVKTAYRKVFDIDLEVIEVNLVDGTHVIR